LENVIRSFADRDTERLHHRESVSRFLADLERAGIVRPGRGRVTVLAPEKLRNYIF